MNPETLKAFLDPPALLRAAPFWSWNNRLDADQLRRQIDVFKRMGMGGFHMHPRTGLDTEYLGDEFMAAVRACVDKAAKEGLLAWLYDEDRWPSGAAGGLVTADPRYRLRRLLFTPCAYAEAGSAAGGGDSRAEGVRTGNGRLLARYDVTLNAEGRLAAYRRLPVGADSPPPAHGAVRWHARLEPAAPSSWFNNATYADTLNPAAIRRFVEVTHERYKAAVGDAFGATIPAIFTDEPQFSRMRGLGRATDRTDLVLPFTDDLPETFREAHGGDLLDHLPEVFWDLPEGASAWRYRYHDHVCERFAQAFADTVGGWCADHGIALTGHLMEEATLTSQVAAVGEAMRHYRSFQIPGIDVLCDRMEDEFNTAKQAQSAARQYGRPGVLSELYGVTNWSFDFPGHKRQGDWQMALGVLYRVPHLAHVSMAGEAKRDYPASIGYQSPWWPWYRRIEDHFARAGALMSRGRPRVRIGVIHPVESFWLCCGPLDQTAAERADREAAFADLTRWLLYGFADFDFISEALLPRQAAGADASRFRVGQMAYDAVVVPNLRTIRSTTLARLERFADAGGAVLFAGEIPDLVDAAPSAAPAALAARCLRRPLARAALLEALAPFCDVRLLNAAGAQVHGALHQVREEDGDRYIFLCNTDRERAMENLELRVRGAWQPQHFDTHSGAIAPLPAEAAGDWTRIPCRLDAHGSLLLALEPGAPPAVEVSAEPPLRETARLADPVPVTLSERNVLVLDTAAYRIGDGAWSEPLPILELDGRIGAALGLPPRGGHMAQPWTDREPLATLATVQVRLAFASEVPVAGARLALEGLANTRIRLDGQPQTGEADGWFTDEAIRTVPLEDMAPGAHRIELEIAYHRKSCIECFYLLGDFGVNVRGRHALVTEPVRELAFGDWTRQGLAFYAGNVTYHSRFEAGDAPVTLEIPHLAGALATVHLDDRAPVPLPFAPRRAAFGAIPGPHRLDLTVFGNRVNAFGQLHHARAGGHPEGSRYWWGPESWRSKGAMWTDEYQLWPMGLLSAPRLLI